MNKKIILLSSFLCLSLWVAFGYYVDTGGINMEKKYNRLGKEKSPYLLQHRENPVHWYAWGEEAFQSAQKENKPIFLSIGYSTCYWCHVMEKESFEQQDVADVLNRNFISIKVDREERPDVDDIYMDAVTALTGRGGWPMSVFLTPNGNPFFGGTYFPKDQFLNLLSQIQNAWKNDQPAIIDSGQKILDHFEKAQLNSPISLSEETLKKAFLELKGRFDPIDGGFGSAPKFPPSMGISLLLRIYRRTGNKEALQMVTHTLDSMASGGIYDQLGGGFHRYSTDKKWLAPHFEKMLYDNALLAFTYLEAWQVTKKEMYKSVAKETLDYVLKEMTHPQGGFYSAQDAGEVGKEGEFYVWTMEEIEQILGKTNAAPLISFYGVTSKGNFEGHSILNIDPETDWNKSQQAPMVAARKKLFQKRSQRENPHKDDKVLTAWNGLMIAALSRGFQITQDVRYKKAAQKSARFLKENLWKNNVLLRRYRDGDSRFSGTISDYAFLIYGLLHLYESDFNQEWLDWAIDLQKTQDKLFWDTKEGGYFTSESSDSTLIYKRKDTYDGAIPSGNTIAALNLLRLQGFTFQETYKQRAKELLTFLSRFYVRSPSGYAQGLIALDYYLDQTKELVIIDEKSALTPTNEMRSWIYHSFLPNKVVAMGQGTPFEDKSSSPLFWGKKIIDKKTTAYVCENHTCKQPTTEIKKLKKMAEDHKPYRL